MARQSLKQRNTDQRLRQQRLRDEARASHRPNRDDIARMLLWQTIVGVRNRRPDWRQVLDKLRDEVIGGLERQGFDGYESEVVFEDLVEKYASGDFPFRTKRHLEQPDGDS